MTLEITAQDRKLLLGYLELAGLPDDSPRREELAWAFSEMWELVDEDPERAWRLILAACDEEMAPEVAAFFAAGVLEDLLAKHGPKVIDRVVDEAARNAQLNYLLGGVWQSSMPQDIWDRVAAARKAAW